MVPSVVDMQSAATGIDGLVVVTVKQATDERGTVRELFRASAYAELLAGLGAWQQVNVTETRRGGPARPARRGDDQARGVRGR